MVQTNYKICVTFFKLLSLTKEKIKELQRISLINYSHVYIVILHEHTYHAHDIVFS